ncbi:MAG: helix-turn-helix transcriptional regulator [Pseudomonadota bacterium]
MKKRHTSFMDNNTQKRLLYELNEVLERYPSWQYSPDAVLEILTRTFSKKTGSKREYLNDPVKPHVLLKEQRMRMLLTLDELSKLTGIPRSNLSAMENGRRPIGLKISKILSKAIGLNYKTLI